MHIDVREKRVNSLGVFKFLLVMQLSLDIKFYYVTFGIDVNNNLRVAVPSPPQVIRSGGRGGYGYT